MENIRCTNIDITNTLTQTKLQFTIAAEGKNKICHQTQQQAHQVHSNRQANLIKHIARKHQLPVRQLWAQPTLISYFFFEFLACILV